MYLFTAPWWLKRYYRTLIWDVPTQEKVIYLTFDDGPHPLATPFVLDVLHKANAKATFFCLGKNVANYPSLYERMVEEGHTVGNHTQHHLNGWKVDTNTYVKDIQLAEQFILSNLFRPPYGRISKKSIRYLQNKGNVGRSIPYIICMWSVLSGDFDVSLPKEKCLLQVLKNTKKGSIVVFHDSDKAWQNMSYTLPRMIDHFSQLGYQFLPITETALKKTSL